MKAIVRYGILCIIVIRFGGHFAYGQHPAYFLRNATTSLSLNPAKVPNTDFYLNLPVISDFRITGDMGKISFQKLFRKDPNRGDSLVFDPADFVNTLSSSGSVSTLLDIGILGAGFRIGRNFFSFDVGLHTHADLPYSKDLLLFALQGNENFLGKTMYLLHKDDKVNIGSYLSMGVGYCLDLLPQLTIGMRAKVLFGIANVKVENSEISLHTDENDYTLAVSGNILGRVSSIVPLPGFGTGSEDTTQKEDFSVGNIFRNPGFGIDAGVAYSLKEDMKISLSVTDVGMIRWRAHPEEFRSKNTASPFLFSGVEVDFNNMDNVEELFQNLADSLKQHFDVQRTKTIGYITMLPAKMQAAFEWQCIPVMSLNGLYSLEFSPSGRMLHSLSVFPVLTLGNWFDFTIGNTFTPSNLINPSIALNLRGGGVAFYTAISVRNSLYVKNMEKISIAMGISLMMGKPR